MALISSSKLDKVCRQAYQRNRNEVCYAAIAVGGDGCNPITNMEDVLAALDLNPGSDICISDGEENGSSWFYFLGSEKEVIAKLEAIQ